MCAAAGKACRAPLTLRPGHLTSYETAQAALELYRSAADGSRPVAGLICTHPHVDHFGGSRGLFADRHTGAGSRLRADGLTGRRADVLRNGRAGRPGRSTARPDSDSEDRFQFPYLVEDFLHLQRRQDVHAIPLRNAAFHEEAVHVLRRVRLHDHDDQVFPIDDRPRQNGDAGLLGDARNLRSQPEQQFFRARVAGGTDFRTVGRQQDVEHGLTSWSPGKVVQPAYVPVPGPGESPGSVVGWPPWRKDASPR
ncbi:MBL fold metallo-hydrolase [Streptomyces sp. AV19]|uniref:MBL fold metallo-hydrolase n=1 Tax=Streptomyces sp. AV19 TaxID=2793068 RepID=UPI0032215C51